MYKNISFWLAKSFLIRTLFWKVPKELWVYWFFPHQEFDYNCTKKEYVTKQVLSVRYSMRWIAAIVMVYIYFCNSGFKLKYIPNGFFLKGGEAFISLLPKLVWKDSFKTRYKQNMENEQRICKLNNKKLELYNLLELILKCAFLHQIKINCYRFLDFSKGQA